MDGRPVGEHGPHAAVVLARGHDLGTQPYVGTQGACGIRENHRKGRSLHRERHRAVNEGGAEHDVSEVSARRTEHAVDPAGVAHGPGSVEHAEHLERVEAVGSRVIHDPSSGSATGRRSRTVASRPSRVAARATAEPTPPPTTSSLMTVLCTRFVYFDYRKDSDRGVTGSSGGRARDGAAALPAQRAGLRRRRRAGPRPGPGRPAVPRLGSSTVPSRRGSSRPPPGCDRPPRPPSSTDSRPKGSSSACPTRPIGAGSSCA